jgi:hypothetical protein
MNLQLRIFLRFWGICVFVLGICGFLCPQSSPASGDAADNPVTVFVFVQRTKAHINYSKPDVFHRVVDDVYSYLATKHVALAKDEFGGRTHAEEEMPISTVLNIARGANATYVLYLIVDRPITEWIKVTVRCYNLSLPSSAAGRVAPAVGDAQAADTQPVERKNTLDISTIDLAQLQAVV